MADASTRSSKRKTTSRSANGPSQRSRGGSARASSPAQPSRNGTNTVVITGLATAAAGIVGGVILGKRLNERPRHILGVRVPGSGAGMSDLVKQVKRSGKHLRTAGKQIADLTDEVRAAREKAEDIGRAIS